jgi:hypothetical protein
VRVRIFYNYFRMHIVDVCVCACVYMCVQSVQA